MSNHGGLYLILYLPNNFTVVRYWILDMLMPIDRRQVLRKFGPSHCNIYIINQDLIAIVKYNHHEISMRTQGYPCMFPKVIKSTLRGSPDISPSTPTSTMEPRPSQVPLGPLARTQAPFCRPGRNTIRPGSIGSQGFTIRFPQFQLCQSLVCVMTIMFPFGPIVRQPPSV